MDTLLYDRQQELHLTQVKSAIVVGLGGTGSWVAFYLATSGCENLHLMDADKLEPPNFNRLYISMEKYLGWQKVDAIKEYLQEIRPDCIIQTYGRATEYSLLEVPDGDILFDCTDNQATQVMLYKWATENKRQYIRCGYDGTHMTVVDRVPSWITDDEPVSGYEIRPSWVVPASLAAAFAVSKAMYAPNTEIRADLKEFALVTQPAIVTVPLINETDRRGIVMLDVAREWQEAMAREQVIYGVPVIQEIIEGRGGTQNVQEEQTTESISQ